MKPETVEAVWHSPEVAALAVSREVVPAVLAALTTTPEYQEMVKNAARYRWLRDDAMLGTRHDPAIAVVDDIEDTCLFGADADAAIDAARGE